MKKLIITGGSGFLGSNFCRLHADAYKLTVVYHSQAIEGGAFDIYQADLADEDQVKRMFEVIQPEGIIHLAALSDPNACELNPEESLRANVIASENIAALAAAYRIPMVFASTDLVFDGKHAPYKERDVPHPVSIYGTHKAIAEESVRDIYPTAVVCRLPLMYGHAYTKHLSFLQPMLDKLRKGEEINLFSDEYRTPLSARKACEGLLLCLQQQEGMTVHLGGDERLSRVEMGELVCEIYGFDKKLIKPVKQRSVKMPAKRPADVSLLNTKAKEMGWQPGTMREELEHIKLSESLFAV